MGGKANQPGPARSGAGASLELRIGQEVVDIWFDSQGIHFRHPRGKRTEGLLPWDVAMAMSLVPADRRPTLDTSVA